jgi:hypothetical protein
LDANTDAYTDYYANGNQYTNAYTYANQYANADAHAYPNASIVSKLYAYQKLRTVQYACALHNATACFA